MTICPYCKSERTRKRGKTKIGTQRFRCLECTKYFTPGTKIPFYLTNTTIQCPYCGTFSISRHGGSKEHPRYQCRECKKDFTESSRVPLYKQETGIKCIHCGSSHIVKGGKQHKKDYNEGFSFLCRACGKKFTLYKKLTDEQKKLIVFYAIGTGVSSKSLAKHFNISYIPVRAFLLEWTKEHGYEYNSYKKRWLKINK